MKAFVAEGLAGFSLVTVARFVQRRAAQRSIPHSE